MRTNAPLSRKASNGFSHVSASKPSALSRQLQPRPFGDEHELGLESEVSPDAQVQASPDLNPLSHKSLLTLPLYPPGTDPAVASAPPPLVQPKLSIGRPGDKYEQEADRTAAKVMAMADPAPQQTVQREAMPEEEEELQTKPLIQREAIAGEDEELQMRSQLQREAMPEEEEELQAKPLVQREAIAGEEEEDVQMKPALQREAMPEEEDESLQAKPQVQLKGNAPEAPENFESQLAQHKGSGQPLSDEARSFMEPRFGADFSNVRVHETPDLANAIQAQAFTHGQDIYFNSGKYNPGSSSGKELLAHELTHTIQQESNLQRQPTVTQTYKPTQPTLKQGSRGSFVQELQKTLNDYGASPPLAVDGIFGSLTQSAVLEFQQTHQDNTGIPLVPDGIVGLLTWEALKNMRTTPASPAVASPSPTPSASTKTPRKLNSVTMKRKHIALKEEDKYGHWWTEVNGSESYGWWPKYKIGMWDTLTGVEGELNGITTFGGTATTDPHHGESADESFHPILTASKTDAQVQSEIRSFASSYSGEWRWTFGFGQNCHTFQENLMNKVGLEEPSKN